MRRRVWLTTAALLAWAGSAAVADEPPQGPLEGHGGPVMGLAAQGDRALSASFDYAVGYWDLAAGEPRWLDGHEAAANAVAFVGNERAVSGDNDGLAVSGGDDGLVIVWDLSSGEALHRMEGHAGKVLGVAASPDGSLVASAAWDGRAGLWDPSSGELVRWIEGFGGNVNDVAFGQGGSTLYAAAHDGTVRAFDVASGEERAVLAEHGFGVNRVAVDEEAGWLAYGALDGGVKVLDLGTGAELADFTTDRRPILALALSPDGGTLAIGDGEGHIALVDTTSWLVLRAFRAVLAGPVWALAFTGSADGGGLLSGGLDAAVAVWPLNAGEPDALAAAQGPEQQPFHRDPAKMPNGERQFVRKCSICHSLGTEPDRRAGPPLGGVFGREAGTLKGYAYSKALLSSGLIWTDETIDALFREGPDVVTPGSKMPLQRINGDQDRADLIAYLKRATAPPATNKN